VREQTRQWCIQKDALRKMGDEENGRVPGSSLSGDFHRKENGDESGSIGAEDQDRGCPFREGDQDVRVAGTPRHSNARDYEVAGCCGYLSKKNLRVYK